MNPVLPALRLSRHLQMSLTPLLMALPPAYPVASAHSSILHIFEIAPTDANISMYMYTYLNLNSVYAETVQILSANVTDTTPG